MSTFDPGAPDDKPDLERIAEALAGILRELQKVRRAIDALAGVAAKQLRRPNWPPEPPGVRSRR